MGPVRAAPAVDGQDPFDPACEGPKPFAPKPRSRPRGRMSNSRSSVDKVVDSAVLVRVPNALRTYTAGQDEILLDAPSVANLLDRLEEAFPGIRDRVLDETGRLRRYVNVFVNEDQVQGDLGRVTLAPGDVVHILPSVAGG